MPVLHVENVPEDLLARLKQLAAADDLSLGEKTVRLLRRAVAAERPQDAAAVDRANVSATLAELRRNAIVPAPGMPDSSDLLREDRAR